MFEKDSQIFCVKILGESHWYKVQEYLMRTHNCVWNSGSRSVEYPNTRKDLYICVGYPGAGIKRKIFYSSPFDKMYEGYLQVNLDFLQYKRS